MTTVDDPALFDAGRQPHGQDPGDEGAVPRRGLARLRPRRPDPRSLLALLSGLVLYAAFPPIGWWPLAAVGVAGLTIAVRGARLRLSYRLGFYAGLAFLLPLLTFVKFVGDDAWIALSVAEAAIFALAAPLMTLVQRLPGWQVWVACLWIGQEALRGRQPFGGFPWGRLAFSQPATPTTRLAAIGGAPLVSFAVALAGTLLATAVLVAVRRRTFRVVVPVAGLALGAVAVSVVGLAVPLPTAPQTGTVTVAAIQGDVPARGGLAALGRKLTVTRNHVAQTEKLAADVRAGKVPAPDLVLWPENSSDLDPFQDPDAAALLTQAAQAIDRPILVGAVLDDGPGKVKNAGLVWGPDGYEGQMYVKQHPVPFAEYLPGRPVLQKLITRFANSMPNDFVHGKAPGIIRLNGQTLGDVICFEVAYDGLVREAVDDGGRLLVVQTNNASFGLTGESPQQLAMSRLRAVEHGRSTVVVSTSGISALIRPNGDIVARSGQYVPAVLVSSLPLRTSRTVADRVGYWPEVAMTTLGLLAAAGAVVVSRRRRAVPAEAPAIAAPAQD